MPSKKKVLLMGKSGAGKTSMRSIIFANYIPRDTERLGPTIDVEHSHVRFLGNLVLNLWDCGGQDVFMEHYLESQRDHVFKNVEVLIYVFDVESSKFKEDLRRYKSCIEAIMQNSKSAKVFCLLHKMDLIPENKRIKVFQEKAAELVELSKPMKIKCYRTSIWDETLYKAWSRIVYSLIPNVKKLENNLVKFCKVCEADEVVLFEKETFLVISHAATNSSEQEDAHRFEKISNIMKQFKLSCKKNSKNFSSMEVKNSKFSGYIEGFTSNTYIMVIMTDNSIQSASTHLNIKVAKNYFEKFFNSSML